MGPIARVIGRTVAITATVTSVFWVALGSWLWIRHADDRPTVMAAPEVSAVASPSRAASAAYQGNALIMPVVGARRDELTDTFNDSRGGDSQGVASPGTENQGTEPQGNATRRHEAIDIMAPEGTPIVAAAPGQVEKLFVSKNGGNTVYVRSPDRRTIYYYAHLRNYAIGLSEGQPLARGAPIGNVGHTGDGNADAPHLHFAIMQTVPERHWYEESVAVDPYPALKAAPAAMP